jgi:hypothetical protein
MLTAGLFWLVGPSVIALKAIPIVLTLVAALLVWRSSREYFGDRYGPLEGAIFWIFPAASLLLLMKAQVVYASGSCFMVLLLMLALRMRRDATPIHFVLFGFITGLSLWATPLALATIIPMAAVVFLVTWRKHVMNLLAIPAAIVGAFPWLAYGARNKWVVLQQVGGLHTTYGSRVKGCFLELYPLLLGLRKPITLQWVLGPVIGPLLYLALFAAMIGLPLWRYRAKVLPIVVPVLVFPFLYAASTTNWYTAEPRHGMLIAPLMLMLAAAIVPRALPAQIGAFAVALALTASAPDPRMNPGCRVHTSNPSSRSTRARGLHHALGQIGQHCSRNNRPHNQSPLLWLSWQNRRIHAGESGSFPTRPEIGAS